MVGVTVEKVAGVAKLQQKKARLDQVDLLRGLAILAVLVIHVTSTGVVLFPAARSGEFYLAVNRLASFAVPVFIFLSALSLTYSFTGRRRSWREFYARRCWRVVFPYLAWSGLYLVYRFWWLGEDPSAILLHANWLQWLFLGTSFYHLYFLPLVLQLYLLFPLFLIALNSRSWSFGAFTGIFAGAALVWEKLNQLYIYPHFPYTATLLLSYLPLVAVGAWLGAHAEGWPAWWRTWRWPIVLLTLVGGAAYWQFYRLIFAGAPVNDYLVAASFSAYSTGAALLFLGLAGNAGKRIGPGRRFFSHLGEASFGIYLVHPLLLNEWQRLFPAASGVAFHLVVLGGFLFILSFSWGLTLAFRKLAGLLRRTDA